MCSTKTGVERSWSPQMVAWQIDSYGTFENLTLNDQVPTPDTIEPNEVLVRVRASSINPIDVLMIGKYINSQWRQWNIFILEKKGCSAVLSSDVNFYTNIA